MLSLSVAEAILSLFVSQETAANIVGDLAEEAQAPGLVRFWRDVLATAFALCLDEIWSHRYRVALSALCGLVVTQIAVSGVIPFTLTLWT